MVRHTRYTRYTRHTRYTRYTRYTCPSQWGAGFEGVVFFDLRPLLILLPLFIMGDRYPLLKLLELAITDFHVEQVWTVKQE